MKIISCVTWHHGCRRPGSLCVSIKQELPDNGVGLHQEVAGLVVVQGEPAKGGDHLLRTARSCQLNSSNHDAN